MPRYRVRSDWEEWGDDYTPFVPNLTVDTDWGVDTGLLDAHGNKIFRQPNPIGFHAEIED